MAKRKYCRGREPRLGGEGAHYTDVVLDRKTLSPHPLVVFRVVLTSRGHHLIARTGTGTGTCAGIGTGDGTPRVTSAISACEWVSAQSPELTA
jgi:hypothetical protein